MKIDDPSILSGLLDGELDSGQQRQVELALRGNPRLAGELEDVALVRGVLTSLPAPHAPRDIAPEVVDRLADEQRRIAAAQSRARWRIGRLWGYVATVAASFALAWSLRLLDTSGAHPRNQLQPGGGAGRVGPIALAPRAEENRDVPREADLESPAALASATPDSALLDDPVDRALEIEAKWLDDRARLRGLLGRADAHRVLITLGSFEAEMLQRIDHAMHSSPRLNRLHARLEIGHDLVIDSEHPDGAVVYAVVLDEYEYRALRHQLVELVGDSALHESAAAAATVALLAEVGPVSFSEVPARGTVIASAVGSSSRLAMRSAAKAPDDARSRVKTLHIEDSSPSTGYRPDLPSRHAEDGADRSEVDRTPRAAPGPNAHAGALGSQTGRERVSPEIVPYDLDEVVRAWDFWTDQPLDDSARRESRHERVYLIWVTSSRPGS